MKRRRFFKTMVLLWKRAVFHARDRFFAASLPFREAAGLRASIREQGGSFLKLGWLALYAPPARANAWLKNHPRYLALTKAGRQRLAARHFHNSGDADEISHSPPVSSFDELPDHIREHYRSARLPEEESATLMKLRRYSVESICIIDNPAGLAYETLDEGQSFSVQKFERVDLRNYPLAGEAPIAVRRVFRLKELH
jgi:hypothetical protein